MWQEWIDKYYAIVDEQQKRRKKRLHELEQENKQLKQKIKDLQESIRNIINNM